MMAMTTRSSTRRKSIAAGAGPLPGDLTAWHGIPLPNFPTRPLRRPVGVSALGTPHCIDIRAILESTALAKNRFLDYSPAMPILGNYRRKGGSGTGRLRRAAVCLGLAAFLAAGCAGDFLAAAAAGATPIQPPLPISEDGLPRDRSPCSWRAIRPPLRPAATLAAKPAADDQSYRLPSLKLATDGPLQRLFEPTNDGPWSPDQAVLPWAEFHDNLVTVHNIRNSAYRTVDDYTVRLYDKTFDLRKLDLGRFHRRAVQRQSVDRPRDAQLRLRGQGLPGQLGRDPQACRAEVQRPDRLLQPVHADVRAGRRARRALEGDDRLPAGGRSSIARRPRPSRPRRCSST